MRSDVPECGTRGPDWRIMATASRWPLSRVGEDDGSCHDPALLDDWHVIGFGRDVAPGGVLPVRLLGRDLVLWRDHAGAAHAWEDLCIHRGSRLSKGCVVNDTIVCPYHGWRYDASSACVLIPATPRQPPPTKARAFPYLATERYGYRLERRRTTFPSFPNGRTTASSRCMRGRICGNPAGSVRSKTSWTRPISRSCTRVSMA